MVSLAASMDADEIKLRVVELEALATSLKRSQKGLRIRLSEHGLENNQNQMRRDRADHSGASSATQDPPLQAIQRLLTRKGDGEITFELVQADGAEVCISLPQRYDLAGIDVAALSTTPGILDVIPY
jgi:DNA polymerase III subunit alpha